MSRGEERRMLRVQRKVDKRGVDSITFQVANHDEMLWAKVQNKRPPPTTMERILAAARTSITT